MSRSRVRFAGRLCVVTGAGSGIGRALALELATAGARLAISDVDEAGLAATARDLAATGAEASSDVVDVADQVAVLDYAERVRSTLGTAQLVINNAGIAHTGDVLEMSFAEMHRVVDVDFWGVVHGTKAFLPQLIESGDANLVNISSLFGLMATPSQSAYNAAKFAVRGFTEALRIEMLASKQPVAVTCVHPGGIRTAIARNASVSAGRDQLALAAFFDARLARMTAERAAQVILRGAAAGRARVLVGADAIALHAMQTVIGSRYQRVVAAVGRRSVPAAR